MMAFCPEHPQWDQNPKFTALSETTSIRTTFMCGVPLPPEGCQQRMLRDISFSKPEYKTLKNDRPPLLFSNKYWWRPRERIVNKTPRLWIPLRLFFTRFRPIKGLKWEFGFQRGPQIFIQRFQERIHQSPLQYLVLHYLLEAGARGLDNVVKQSKYADFPVLESNSSGSHIHYKRAVGVGGRPLPPPLFGRKLKKRSLQLFEGTTGRNVWTYLSF